MNKLSTELHEKIFQLLPRNVLLECTLICLQWLNITRPHLYNIISIKQQDGFKKLMNTINLNPLLGNLVIQLTLNRKTDICFNIYHIYSMLPNLKRLYIIDPIYSVSPLTYNSNNTVAPLSTSTLNEVFEQGDRYEFTQCLIKMNLCCQLRKLTLLHLEPGEENLNPIYYLKNLPVLVELVLDLRLFDLKIEDIEMLHRNVPSIQHLSIKKSTLTPFGKLPVNLEPNITIRSIYWDFYHIDDTQNSSETYVQCFQYIQKKYVNLENIALDSLEYYTLTDYETCQIYNEGWLPILESKGPQLRHIECLDIKPGVDIFKVLDDYGCKVEYLKVSCTGGKIDINKLVLSNQRHYLCTLYVKNALHFHEASLKDTNLEVLSLEYARSDDDKVIILNDLLKLCPDTLHELILMTAVITAHDVDDDDDFQSFITSIEINMNDLGSIRCDESEIYKVTSKLCPNLKSVSMLDIWQI